MTGPVDDYVGRLQRELQKRGLDDPRTLEEAREHLVDAVERGRERGLSVDDAEREAIERFGSPDIVAAQVYEERDHMRKRLPAALEVVWRRKWWMLAPAVLTALVTSVASHYFLPTRYRSEATILVVPARVPDDYAGPRFDPSKSRMEQLTETLLSRTRLERIIKDYGLQAEYPGAIVEDVVHRMRQDVTIDVTPDAGADSDLRAFRVGFVSSDPRVAMRVTERLASLLINENLRDREVLVKGTAQFIESQIEDVAARIRAMETMIADMRARNGREPVSQADLLPYEVLQEHYRALLVKREEITIASNLERRQIGEQFRIIDPPRLPTRPVGPSRRRVNVLGAFAGLALGLVLVGVRGRNPVRPT